MDPNRTARSRLALVFGLALLLGLGTVAAEAQTLHLYACKVVCGYQKGNVKLLNDTSNTPTGFEDLKPGNYATVCNMFNHDIFAASQPVFPYLAVDGGGLIFLGQINVGVLNAAAYGCPRIVANLPAPPTIPIFEGYLTLFTTSPNFKVDEVNTFESQNAFERHALWAFLIGGPFRLAARVHNLSIPRITSPLAFGAGFLNPNELLTSSGAGGLGLGASIDVEEVRRVDINLTATTPEDQERIPPEVRDHLEDTGQL